LAENYAVFFGPGVKAKNLTSAKIVKSDLYLCVSYFASQSKGTNFGD